MRISYEKLWNLLEKNKMKRSELAKAINVSSNTVTKLNQNRPVRMSVIMNICKVFHCDIGDVMEIIEDE